jgi:hypothetical protein
MKLFTFIILLISVSAFAQQKDKPVKYIDRIDSLDLDITWDEIFRSSGFDGPSRYADPELAKQMREWMQSRQCPYVWTDKNRPIVLDANTYQQWVKSDQDFKKSYQRADSLMRLNQNTLKHK